MLKLEHPGRAALTLGLIGAPAAFIWLGSHDSAAWVRAVATVCALGVCGAIAYGLKLLTIPPALAAEAAADRAKLTKQLASFDEPDDDAGLQDGIAYALTGKWDGQLWAREGALGYVHEIAERIRKLAVRGRVHIWGTAGGAAEVHQLVPPDFLQTTPFDFLSLTASLAHTVRTEKKIGAPISRWHHLRINRAEFEREFPTPWKPEGAP